MAWDFYWIDPDSAMTQLGQVSTTKVLNFSGLGMAPLEHFLEGVPSQHRQLHRGLKFRPRIVQLEIVDRQSSAANQDTRQTTLLAALNPDRGEGILKMVLSDGSTTRYLGCRVQDGPDFLSTNRPRAAGDQIYIVRFVARDPFLYDPEQQSASDNFNGAVAVDIACDNSSGHMGTSPVIEIAGEVQNPKIELVSTGEYIWFDAYTVPAAETLTVDCEAGTAKLSDGTSKIAELKKQSTMFYLPRGDQVLRLTCTSGVSQVTVSWYSRFLGL